MEVNINNSKREPTYINNSIKTDKNNNENRGTIDLSISENYQVFLSIIFFLIGCIFLFYLFSFVFSIYVSYI